MIKYRVGKSGSDAWTPPLDAKEAIKKIKLRAKLYTGPYQIKERGEIKWGPKRPLKAAVKRLKLRVEDGQVGDMFLLKATPAVILRVRVVEVKPDLAPPPSVGTPKLRDFHQAVFGKFPELESWGICNCRFISGSTTWSQHAYCNAEDLRGPTMKYMDEVHDWIMANKDKYDIRYVAWRVTDHYDHLHVDFNPWGTGTPACA